MDDSTPQEEGTEQLKKPPHICDDYDPLKIFDLQHRDVCRSLEQFLGPSGIKVEVPVTRYETRLIVRGYLKDLYRMHLGLRDTEGIREYSLLAPFIYSRLKTFLDAGLTLQDLEEIWEGVILGREYLPIRRTDSDDSPDQPTSQGELKT